MSTLVKIYKELVDAALEDESAKLTMTHTQDFYLSHPIEAFLCVLLKIDQVDVLRLPVATILTQAQQCVSSGQLGPRQWFEPAVRAASDDFRRYKNYVAQNLLDFAQCMAETGEFDNWVNKVKITDLRSGGCAMWSRITNHSSGLYLEILSLDLADRLQSARLQPNSLRPPIVLSHADRSALLTSVNAYINESLRVARRMLRAAWRESLHNRISRLVKQARPGDLITKALEIPNFAPSLADLQQEAEALYRQYTDRAALVQDLTADAQVAEREHRGRSRGTVLWNARAWLVAKLERLISDAKAGGGVRQEDDDGQETLHEATDAQSMRQAIDAFVDYLGETYMSTQVAIVRDEIQDATRSVAMIVSGVDQPSSIMDVHFKELQDLADSYNTAKQHAYEEYEMDHSSAVDAFRIEQQHLAGRADASQRLANRITHTLNTMDRWFVASDSVAVNIGRAADSVCKEDATAGAAPAPACVRHTTRLLLHCRDLADRVNAQLEAAIRQRQSELAHLWDVRLIALTDLADVILKAPASGGGGGGAATAKCAVSPADRPDFQKLLHLPVKAQLRMRLRALLEDHIVGMQRPLEYRPGSSREQCRRVLADLRTLHAQTENQQPAKPPLTLGDAWHQLPGLVWASAYIELIEHIEPSSSAAANGDNGTRRPVSISSTPAAAAAASASQRESKMRKLK